MNDTVKIFIMLFTGILVPLTEYVRRVVRDIQQDVKNLGADHTKLLMRQSLMEKQQVFHEERDEEHFASNDTRYALTTQRMDTLDDRVQECERLLPRERPKR